MGNIHNSIIIHAPYEKVFEVSNDLSRWTKFRAQFCKVETIEQTGNKVVFKLTHTNQMSWKVYRFLSKDDKFVYSEKLLPCPPFVYMKMVWLYRKVKSGTEITWIEDFLMEKGAKYTDEEGTRLISEWSRKNLHKLKEIVEKET